MLHGKNWWRYNLHTEYNQEILQETILHVLHYDNDGTDSVRRLCELLIILNMSKDVKNLLFSMFFVQMSNRITTNDISQLFSTF